MGIPSVIKIGITRNASCFFLRSYIAAFILIINYCLAVFYYISLHSAILIGSGLIHNIYQYTSDDMIMIIPTSDHMRNSCTQSLQDHCTPYTNCRNLKILVQVKLFMCNNGRSISLHCLGLQSPLGWGVCINLVNSECVDSDYSQAVQA